ncbi:hypothetical protein [Aestuariivirga sp.]|uniref:hypothetical protein n=1 Tax=Aestuariivirga sp. TaxID=2650926 RepID=UPI0039E3F486
MTNIRFAAFTGSTVFALGMLALSQGAGASITSKLNKCVADNAGAVVSCCETVTADRRPVWMVQANANCGDIVVCKERRCYVRQLVTVNDKKTHDNGGRKR